MADIIQDNLGSDVLNGWEKELVLVLNKLKIAEAETLKTETTYSNALQWEAKLKAWQDSLLQTADLTKLLEAELTVFKRQLGIVSFSTDCTVHANDILYCQVKKVFSDAALKGGTDEKYTCDVESLSQGIRGLQEAVYCLGNPPNLNKNGGFLKKVTELEAKLKIVEDMREDILKKLIALVQSVNQMEIAICSNHYGLQGIIATLEAEFIGGDTRDEAGESLSESLSMPTTCGCHEANHSCDSELTPTICFPLRTDPFVCNIVSKYTASVDEKIAAAKAYNKSRQDRDCILTRKNGLEKAIAAATAAKK